MEYLKIALYIVYAIVAVTIIVVSLTQAKQSNGASDAVMGGVRESFYEKNKGKTDEAKATRLIIFLWFILVVLSVAVYFIN